MNLRRCHFYIAPDAVNALRALAAKRGVSMAELVRLALERLLDDAKGTPPA